MCDIKVHITNSLDLGIRRQNIIANSFIFRGCLELLHKLYSMNSTVEQLHKKLEFVKYLFRCSHNFTLFPRTECVELNPFS
jgi:hypothetical protein